MKSMSKKQYILWVLDHMLTDEMTNAIVAAEECSWPIDADGNPVHSVPAERFELYVFARMTTTPDGLTPAPPLPIESFLREKQPQLFLDNE